MQPVAVGGLDQDIIRLFHIFGILEDRLVFISEISGEYYLLRDISLGQPYFHCRRAQQMPHIRESDIYSFAYIHPVVIGHRHEAAYRIVCIGHVIQRSEERYILASLCLTVAPLRLEHLDMRRVSQHDACQVCRSLRSVYAPRESVLCQQRQQSRVVYMCMCKKDIIDLRRLYRQVYVFKQVLALLHTIVHQDMFATGFEIMAAAGNFMSCTHKCKLHTTLLSTFKI